MGMRLHVAKVYKIEYANAQAFNYKVSEFKNLLDAIYVTYNGETYDNDFEVSKEELKAGVDLLKNIESLPPYQKDWINGALWSLECNIEEVIETLEYCLNNADPDNDYMLFSFF